MRGCPDERARPPTIRDVAARARTSIATVSYALNDRERYLRPELRERVIQAAQELGYVRNAAASSLRGMPRGLLRRDRVPTVVLERTLGEVQPAQDFVGHDNFQSGLLATQRLLAAGHRRIAFLGWDSPIPNIHDRARGYRAALTAAGITAPPDWVLVDALTQEGGARMAQRLLRLPVTAAVIAHHHDLAKGVLLGLMQAGRRWPDDLSLVLIGTPDWRELVTPSLACVARPEAEMGREAARMLLRKLSQPDDMQMAMILPSTFIAGGSIRTLDQREQR